MIKDAVGIECEMLLAKQQFADNNKTPEIQQQHLVPHVFNAILWKNNASLEITAQMSLKPNCKLLNN